MGITLRKYEKSTENMNQFDYNGDVFTTSENGINEFIYKGYAFLESDHLAYVLECIGWNEADHEGYGDWFDYYLCNDGSAVLREVLNATIENFNQGVNIAILEADYSFKYWEMLQEHPELEEELDNTDKYWCEHYALGVEKAVDHLRLYRPSDVRGTLLDEIKCEDLLEDFDIDFVLDYIMEMIFPE